MKARLAIFAVFAFVVSFVFIAIPVDTEAMPYFSRRISKDCTYCHTSFPKLNETGRVFRSNGYRFAENTGEGMWQEVKDWSHIPLSMEVEVEGEYTSKDPNAGLKTKETELKLEEVEFISGGVLGKDGKISYLAVAGVEQHGDGTYEAFTGPAFLQVNDMLGPTGEGLLNFKAGQWALGLPFLSHDQRVVKNKYFAQNNIGALTTEQRAFELNGSIVGEEDTWMPTHRYYLGLTREDIKVNAADEDVEGDPFKGYYGIYSMTFKEKYNLGFIYRSTEEANGAAGDFSIDQYDKFGAAIEGTFGHVSATAGYFQSDAKNHGNSDLDNYMVELRYKPIKKLTLGARYDVLEDKTSTPGLDDAEYTTVSAKYFILSNVYMQLEYRMLRDDDGAAGTAGDEDRIRYFFVLLI